MKKILKITACCVGIIIFILLLISNYHFIKNDLQVLISIFDLNGNLSDVHIQTLLEDMAHALYDITILRFLIVYLIHIILSKRLNKKALICFLSVFLFVNVFMCIPEIIQLSIHFKELYASGDYNDYSFSILYDFAKLFFLVLTTLLAVYFIIWLVGKQLAKTKEEKQCGQEL